MLRINSLSTMKLINIITLLAITYACHSAETKSNSKDEILTPLAEELNTVEDPSMEIDKSKAGLNLDSLLTNSARQLLKSIKNKEWGEFASYIHPIKGVRFSPYAYIDTTNAIVLRQNTFILGVEDVKMWGYYDGSEDSIMLTLENYFNRFVYDTDFLHAEEMSINKILGAGNSLNNRMEIYPNSQFISFYFSGFDPKYDGLDWTSLNLFFEKLNGELFIVAVIHDQWTI